MKTTKTQWIVNRNQASINDSSLYTMEALREEFGNLTWTVSTVIGEDKERLIDCMDWNAFIEFYAQNNGQVGWLHIVTEAPEDSQMAVFGFDVEMWVCPISVNDVRADEWKVYENTPVEGGEVASFPTLLEAVCYILDETNNETKLDPRDTDNGNNHHWFEVYNGEPVTETDDDTIYNTPFYVSKKFYTC